MSFANSVTIGPKFFQKAFNDYANRYWAFVREILQNSIDCGSTEISIEVQSEAISGTTKVVVINNGEPMSSDTLVNKLLSLGESGKDFQGSVGGFGKAKEILYFAHRDYTIVTGGLHVHGSGAGYNLEQAAVPQEGTLSLVTWEGEHRDALLEQFKRFIELCGTGDKVRFYLNRERVKPKHAAGVLNRTLDRDGKPWAEVRLTTVEKNLLVVRIGGIPMFYKRVEFKGTVQVELTGTSGQRLTSNRDGLRWPFCDRLTELVTSIAIDKKTVFKLEKAEYTRYRGPKLNRPKPKINVQQISAAKAADHEELVENVVEEGIPDIFESIRGPEAAPAPGGPQTAPGGPERPQAPLVQAPAAEVQEAAPMGGAGILVDVIGQQEAASPLNHEFVIKNGVKRAVPKEFEPATFSDHAKWLAKAWAGCLLELHAIYQLKEEFSVGFLFSEDLEAEYEASGDYGRVFFLNPCDVTRKKTVRRFKKADKGQLIADAAHEFVHGLGFSYHDEAFASKLTEVMGFVFANYRRFTRHLG
jgi:hypothetical protein